MPTIPTDLRARVEAALTDAGRLREKAIIADSWRETGAGCADDYVNDVLEMTPGVVESSTDLLRALLALLDAPAGLTVGAATPIAMTGRYHKVLRVSGKNSADNWLSWLTDEERAEAMKPEPPPPEPRRPVAGWRAGVSGDELFIGTFLRLRAGAFAWEVEAVKTRGLARWCETLKSGVVTGGPDAAKLAAEDAAASLVDAANTALGRQR